MKVNIETNFGTYRQLFNVVFDHSGYQTPMDNFLMKGISIVPDEDTQQLFTSYKMDYRFFNNVLICYMQCGLLSPPTPEPKIPFVTIDGNIKIRFLVRNSGDFFNKTFVVAAGSKKIYQFSNKINNVNLPDVFLTAPVESYAAANDYDQGTIVQNGGNMFTALKTVLAANGIAITDTNFWKQITGVDQVVNNADLQDAATVDTNEDCFAVIDLYNSGTTNSSYNLFGASKELFVPAPSFKIKFKSKF
jgi:hypothetical protein